MSSPLWGAAFGLLLTACQYEVVASAPDASGPFVGSVDLTWAPTTTGVTANFTESRFADGGCPGTQTGACCSYAQPGMDLSNGGVEPITVSAGMIALADGPRTLGSLGFEGIGYEPLSSAEVSSLSWTPGDTLAVSAAGGTVAAFSGFVVAPRRRSSGVSPELTVSGQIVVRLDAGLHGELDASG